MALSEGKPMTWDAQELETRSAELRRLAAAWAADGFTGNAKMHRDSADALDALARVVRLRDGWKRTEDMHAESWVRDLNKLTVQQLDTALRGDAGPQEGA